MTKKTHSKWGPRLDFELEPQVVIPKKEIEFRQKTAGEEGIFSEWHKKTPLKYSHGLDPSQPKLR